MIFRIEEPIQMTSYRNRIYEHGCMVIVVLFYMDKGLLPSVVSNIHTKKWNEITGPNLAGRHSYR